MAIKACFFFLFKTFSHLNNRKRNSIYHVKNTQELIEPRFTSPCLINVTWKNTPSRFNDSLCYNMLLITGNGGNDSSLQDGPLFFPCGFLQYLEGLANACTNHKLSYLTIYIALPRHREGEIKQFFSPCNFFKWEHGISSRGTWSIV